MNEKLSDMITDWATVNKKVFWKYEVAAFYKTYKINVFNLPEPSITDIKVQSYRSLLNDAQKTELCKIVKNAYNGSGKNNLPKTSLRVQLDYSKGAVKTEIK